MRDADGELTSAERTEQMRVFPTCDCKKRKIWEDSHWAEQAAQPNREGHLGQAAELLMYSCYLSINGAVYGNLIPFSL